MLTKPEHDIVYRSKLLLGTSFPQQAAYNYPHHPTQSHQSHSIFYPTAYLPTCRPCRPVHRRALHLD